MGTPFVPSTLLTVLVAIAAVGCGRIDFDERGSSASCGSDPVGSAPYSGGSGSVDDPYQVCSPDQLVTLAGRPGDFAASFILLHDLDFQGVSFEGIGTAGAPFRGVIDGNGHTLANLDITGAGQPVGFLGASRGARLRNLTFDNASVSGSGSASAAGLVAGDCDSTQVRALTVTNVHVQGDNNVGGVFGSEYACQVVGASLSGTVAGSVQAIGGVVGAAERGSYVDIDSTIGIDAPLATGVGGAVGIEGDSPVILEDVHVQATVVGDAHVGGLLGENDDGMLIYRSAFAGSVRGGLGVGGIVGVNYDVPFYVYSTSARADLTGNTEVGGLAGEMGEGARYYDCSATGTITGVGTNQASFGGFAGLVTYYGRIERSYAHVTIDSQASAVGGFLGDIQYWSSDTANYDITSSFVAADVTGSSSTSTISLYVGLDTDPNPLVGTGSYYWSGGSCINNGGGGCAGGGSGVADETQFQDPTKAPLSSWDFAEVWQQQTGSFPTLRTEQPRAPTVTEACPRTAIVGLEYLCNLSVTDGDKNEARLVVFEPQHTCAWALANAQPNGSLYGSPANDDVGSCTMALAVTDGAHETAVPPFQVDVQKGVLISPASGSQPSYGFAPQAVGSSSTVTFTLTNNESVPATGVAITGLPAGAFDFAGGAGYPGTAGTCTDTLAPGASCTVAVKFAPTVAGSTSAVVAIHFTAALGPASYPFTLSGYGL